MDTGEREAGSSLLSGNPYKMGCSAFTHVIGRRFKSAENSCFAVSVCMCLLACIAVGFFLHAARFSCEHARAFPALAQD